MNLSECNLGKQKLTVLCHQDDVEITNDLEDTVEITPEDTLARAAQLTEADWVWLQAQPDFMRRLRCVFKEDRFPEFKGSFKMQGHGLKHTVGLILLLLIAAGDGKRPFVRFPESFLHPSQQSGLADLFTNF